jgi:hypothetical protein
MEDRTGLRRPARLILASVSTSETVILRAVRFEVCRLIATRLLSFYYPEDVTAVEIPGRIVSAIRPLFKLIARARGEYIGNRDLSGAEDRGSNSTPGCGTPFER